MIERIDDLYPTVNSVYQKFIDEHLKRYEIVSSYLSNLELSTKLLCVVDAACGAGFGYKIVKPKVKRFIGVDRDVDQILLNRERYRVDGSVFTIGDITNKSFLISLNPDIIISFETIEHLSDPMGFIFNCYDILPPGGLFFLSAPTCLTRDYDPFHKWDFSSKYLRSLLQSSKFKIHMEISMPFTAPFHKFIFAVPTTLKQKFDVLYYIFTHPDYFRERVITWFRNRFEWESTMFICEKV